MSDAERLQAAMIDDLTQRCFERIRGNARLQMRGSAAFTMLVELIVMQDQIARSK